jgi:hypothetical protein
MYLNYECRKLSRCRDIVLGRFLWFCEIGVCGIEDCELHNTNANFTNTEHYGGSLISREICFEFAFRFFLLLRQKGTPGPPPGRAEGHAAWSLERHLHVQA